MIRDRKTMPFYEFIYNALHSINDEKPRFKIFES